MESILTTVKVQLGIVENCTDFDQILITHINSVFSILHQLGVGPANGFFITDNNQNWSSFIGSDVFTLQNVKTYMYLKVKLMFDPPQNSAMLESINRQIAEHEWRLNVAATRGVNNE